LHRSIDAIEEDLQTASATYAHIPQALAGILASLFLLISAFFLFFSILQTSFGLLISGTGAMLLAWRLFSSEDSSTFLHYGALSLSLAGQALFTFAWVLWLDKSLLDWTLIFFVIAGLEAVLIIMIDHHFHRLLSAFTLAITLYCGFYLLGIGSIAVALMIGSIVWVRLHEASLGKRIVFYDTITTGLSAGILYWTFWGYTPYCGKLSSLNAIGNTPSAYALTSGAVLLYTIGYLMRTSTLSNPYRLAIYGFTVVVIFLGSKMIGLPVLVTLLIIGFAGGSIALQAASLIGLLWSVGHFYYTLETTLMIKSAMLVAMGAVLLAAYRFVRTLERSQEKHA
jgi:hypothetical protein